MENSVEEWEVEKIINRHCYRQGWQYLVQWKGWDSDANNWLPSKEVDELQALDVYLADNNLSTWTCFLFFYFF